jgi:hypothetical protein
MGLDMYAYAAAKEKQYEEYWENGEYDPDTKDYVNKTVTKPKELAYWRKHPNLHGWFEEEWRNSRYLEQPTDATQTVDPESDMFNGVELEIDWAMLERLESAIVNGELPATSGFFFGNSADDYYRAQDLEFVRQARAELFLGLRVFYNSSW